MVSLINAVLCSSFGFLMQVVPADTQAGDIIPFGKTLLIHFTFCYSGIHNHCFFGI
jgi:hypothetical protein